MVFAKEHEDLVVEGGKWLKRNATSCTISAVLIATVVFAAIITIPGGIDSNGIPIFSKDGAFIVFIILDALSLFTSITSLLLFLSILTSRCAEDDFLCVLPKMLIFGKLALFISITTMLGAFCVFLYLVLGHKESRIYVIVAALACIPVTTFVFLQFPLLVDLISSTYGRGIFGKQSDRQFF